MSNWYPTEQLRFVWKVEMLDQTHRHKVKVLQQLWQYDTQGLLGDDFVEKEWRDVQLVEEGRD